MIALCLGGALSFWDDMARAKALIGDKPYLVIAANYAGIEYAGHIDAWVSLHPDRMAPWMAERAARGGNTDYRQIGHAIRCKSTNEIILQRWNGSSGLYAAQVAFDAMDASGAILCGVPMDDTGGHIHWAGDWTHAHNYTAGFRQAKTQGANIRSMGGWTAELFGSPDTDWITSCAS